MNYEELLQRYALLIQDYEGAHADRCALAKRVAELEAQVRMLEGAVAVLRCETTPPH